MQSKLSDLVDNLSEINKKECPKCMGKNKLNRNVILLRQKIIYYVTDVKNAKQKKKKCCKPINGLIKKFPHIYQFCNGDFNKFVLLLRKGVYSYEYMDGWERFDETLLPDKKAFYSELNLEDITDKDYEHVQNV